MEMGDLMNASLKALLNEQYKLVANLREENKKLKEYNGELIENHKKDVAILCEENKKLKEEIRFLEECLDRKEEVNKKMREELGEYKKMFEDHLKECYIKNTAEFLDKKFPKINGFMEEDTLQELRDLGEI